MTLAGKLLLTVTAAAGRDPDVAAGGEVGDFVGGEGAVEDAEVVDLPGKILPTAYSASPYIRRTENCCKRYAYASTRYPIDVDRQRCSTI